MAKQQKNNEKAKLLQSEITQLCENIELTIASDVSHRQKRHQIRTQLEPFFIKKRTEVFCILINLPSIDSIAKAVTTEFLLQLCDTAAISALEITTKGSDDEVSSLASEAVTVIRSRSQSRENFIKGRDLYYDYERNEATDFLKHAIQDEPNGPFACLARGLLLENSRQFENAFSEYNRAQSEWPWIAESYIHLGLTYRRLAEFSAEEKFSNFQSSIDCLSSCLEIAPDLVFAYVGKAWTYLKVYGAREANKAQKDEALKAAEDCIEQALAKSPEYLQAIMTKARIINEKAKSNKSPELKEQALVLGKKVYQSQATASLRSYAAVFIGDWLSQNRPESAQDYYEEALSLGIKENYVYQNYVNLLLKLATENQNRPEYLERAEEICEEWQKVYPDSLHCLATIGRILIQKRNFTEGWNFLSRVIDNPQVTEGLLSFVIPRASRALEELDKPLQAFGLWQMLPESARDHPPNRKKFGRLTTKIKDLQKATEFKLKSIESSLATIDVGKGRPRLTPDLQKKYQTLRNELEQLITEGERSARLLVDLGRAETLLGQYEAAIDYYDKALEMEPLNTFARANKGIALILSARYEEAINELEIAYDNRLTLPFVKNSLQYAKNKSQAHRKQPISFDPGMAIKFFNNQTGNAEIHLFSTMQSFVAELKSKLPIKEVLDQIGEDPVFLLAATGVGKTVTTPMHVFLRLIIKKPQSNKKVSSQVFVVEPRIPIAESEMHHMNHIYSEFVANNIAKKYPEHGRNPFGCITSLGTLNPKAPIVFITTGVFEKMAFENSLIPSYHRVIIDEAHVTLERNIGVEIAFGLCRRKGVPVDFMSATVDPATLEEDLGIKIIDCSERRYPIEYRNSGGTLSETLLTLVDEYLIKRQDLSNELEQWDIENQKPRPVGMLIVVNSHLSENSDTLKYANLIRNKFEDLEVLRLSSAVIRDPVQKKEFDDILKSIEKRNGRYVIIATNVVEMGITYASLDFVVTMDTEYINVSDERGATLELGPLGINALQQRAGRCGRKRPGMCFIAKEYNSGQGTWYSNLDTKPNLHPRFKPEPIKYPLENGSLQQLAFLSFKENESDSNIKTWLNSLRFPSRPETSQDRISGLKQERETMTNNGLAHENRLTSLGKEAEQYIGVEDLDFSVLGAASPKGGETRKIILAIVALSEYTLADFLQSHTGFPEESIARLNLGEKYGPSEDLGISAELLYERVRDDLTKVKDTLFDLDIAPYYVAEISSRIGSGFFPRSAEEITGPTPDSHLDDFETLLEDWNGRLEINKNYLHLEKELMSLDSRSELIALYDIISHFFNNYSNYLERHIPEYIFSHAETAFYRDIEAAGLRAHTVRSAIAKVKDLFRYLGERIPLRVFRLPSDELPTQASLEQLFRYCFQSSANDLTQSDFNICLNIGRQLSRISQGKVNLKPDDHEKLEVSKKLGINLKKLNNLLHKVVFPSLRFFRSEYQLMTVKESKEYLPQLSPTLRDKIYKHIVKHGYGKKYRLKPGAFGYVTTIENPNGEQISVNLSMGQSSLVIRDDNPTVYAKTRPITRPDGKYYLGLTHVTLIED